MDLVSVTSSDVSEHKFQLPETSRLKILKVLCVYIEMLILLVFVNHSMVVMCI